MSRIIFVAIAIAMVFGTLVFAENQDGADVYEIVYKAAVDIYTIIKTENGKEFRMGGAGAFFDVDGHVVTANHVVKLEEDKIKRLEFGPDGFRVIEEKVTDYRYEVIFPKLNRKFLGTLIGWSQEADLATLKVDGIDKSEYVPLKIGDSDKLRVKEPVFVVGTPHGISGSFTKGVISCLHRRHGLFEVEDYIQTDAAINPGNSGGPMVNKNGELVGIVNTKDFRAEGIAYAIPVKIFNVPMFLKSGEVKRLVLGVDALIENPPKWGPKQEPRAKDIAYLQELTAIEGPDDLKTLTTLYQNTWDNYALIKDIKKDSLAEKSKAFKKGDVIVKAGGCNIAGGMDLRIVLLGWDPVKPLELEVLRASGTSVARTKVTISFGPAPAVPAAPANGNGANTEKPKESNPAPPAPPANPHKEDSKLEKKKWS